MLGAKLVPVPLHPRQIPHALTWDLSRASVERDEGLAVRAVSQLGYLQLISSCYLSYDSGTASRCTVGSDELKKTGKEMTFDYKD